eukprot:m.786894 g.786894  ORF g.786894 m.786894 type:complete len:180 (+) comp59184_c0_seq8:1671-2210(+)
MIFSVFEIISFLGSWHHDGVQGLYTVAFRPLFEATANAMEALSGTLFTAKKHGIITYEGQLLLQGINDAVVITLLQETIDDATMEKYMRVHTPSAKLTDGANKGGFTGESLREANLPCVVCTKKVYAMEFVGVSGKALHKTCFRCTVCNSVLNTSSYATMNDLFYCLAHYDQVTKASFL